MEKEIKKIAILHCKKSGRVCTGAACFRAFYDRKKSFEQYEGQPVELSAYFDCNGCEADKLNDPGFTEKLERMKEEHVDRIHIGKCCTEVELSMDSSYPTTLSDCMVSVKERVTLVPSSSRA